MDEDQWHLVYAILRHAAAAPELRIPVTCKIRIFAAGIHRGQNLGKSGNIWTEGKPLNNWGWGPLGPPSGPRAATAMGSYKVLIPVEMGRGIPILRGSQLHLDYTKSDEPWHGMDQ